MRWMSLSTGVTHGSDMFQRCDLVGSVIGVCTMDEESMGQGELFTSSQGLEPKHPLIEGFVFMASPGLVQSGDTR